MSIYATLWRLKFPHEEDDYLGCAWMTVIAQGVPPHLGSPTPGCGYEDGDPYAAFLPPTVHTDAEGEAPYMRAVVFVTEGTPKGTARSAGNPRAGGGDRETMAGEATPRQRPGQAPWQEAYPGAGVALATAHQEADNTRLTK